MRFLKTVTLASLFVSSILIQPVYAKADKIQVRDGQTVTLLNIKAPEMYKVCLDKSEDSASLKVIYDDLEATVKSGNCTDFTAKVIKVTPAQKIEMGKTLSVTYSKVN